MPSVKVQVRQHLMDAYLVESRSIGGLSGSLVFVNLGVARKLGDQVKHAQGEHIPPLLGIVCGHFYSKETDIDSVTDNSHEPGNINVGIAIVTPVIKLVEIIRSFWAD
jgi:hypothetical protein